MSVFVIYGGRKLRRFGVVYVTQQSLHHGPVRLLVDDVMRVP